jgi:2-methylcitrate dehydratase PrpD
MSHFSDEGLQRKDILDLTKQVQPYVDAEMDRDWSRYVTPAKVTVQFRDGQTVEARVDYPKGHPKNRMTEAEFAAKTTDCATYAAKSLPATTADRLMSAVRKLETLPDISVVVGVMTGSEGSDVPT